jgi:hypothetical protein
MQLIVSGLPAVTEANRFRALFGRYVYGFNQWDHCDRCFEARQERKINPTMDNGTVALKDELFYLCGVGRDLSLKVHPQFARKSTNVHLAVRPRKGSIAAIGSVYGASFVIEDAEAITIRPLPDGFQGLPKKYSRCKMFQFAYQMFDVNEVSLSKGTPVYQLRTEWISVPGIRQDGSGRMIDPSLGQRSQLSPRRQLCMIT